MSVVTLLYGNEPQLIEEKKREFLRSYMDLPLVMLNDESGPARISEQLSEDSLFGDAKVFCLVNLPIIKKSGQKDSKEWDALYELLINYTGDNPVLLIYHDLYVGWGNFIPGAIIDANSKFGYASDAQEANVCTKAHYCRVISSGCYYISHPRCA